MYGEVDHHGIARALNVGNLALILIAPAQLLDQGKGVVIVDEPHRLAFAQRFQRAKNRGMAKAPGDAARVE